MNETYSNETYSNEIDYTIRLTKDAPGANWYISVYHADGGAMYDGWWQGSDGKTVEEAVQEALRGACIAASPTLPPLPPLTDSMRAVLRNEKGTYQSEDELYAALVVASTQTKGERE